MNILFITSTKGWGGGEVWLSQVTRGLHERGHAIHIICRPASEFFRRVYLPEIEITAVPLSSDFHPLAVARLYRYIRSRKIDLVCVNMEREQRLGGLAAVLAGIPLVVSREVDRSIKDSFINKLFYKYLTSALIVNSNATRSTVLSSVPWLAGQDIRVIWKGIDVEQYDEELASIERKIPGSSQGTTIGFVGRLDEQKGIRTLLEAMSYVVRQNPAIRLLMAGEGNLRAVIERYRNEHGLENNIIPLGFQEDIPSFLHGVDFVVMPSNWEGFGYAAVEAMAAGKPVIASRVSSLPEIVTDSRDGILVPPRSPADLSQAILTLSANSRLRSQMGAYARRTVETRFTIEAMLEKTEMCFFDLVFASPAIFSSAR